MKDAFKIIYAICLAITVSLIAGFVPVMMYDTLFDIEVNCEGTRDYDDTIPATTQHCTRALYSILIFSSITFVLIITLAIIQTNKELKEEEYDKKRRLYN